MVSELDNWMEWIDNTISDDVAETRTVDDFEVFIGGKGFYWSLLAMFKTQLSDAVGDR